MKEEYYYMILSYNNIVAGIFMDIREKHRRYYDIILDKEEPGYWEQKRLFKQHR
jgi:hypothetical protein